MVRLQDVAEAAGVSKSVASRVLNRDGAARVRPETRQRILAAADDLGYIPNFRARALRHARSGALALIVPYVNNVAFAELYQGVQEAVEDTDFMVLLTEIEWPPEGHEQLRSLVVMGRVDGILLQRREDFDDDTLRSVLGDGLPLMLINGRLSGRPGSVTLPDHASAHIATQHLIDLGHTDIGHVGGTLASDTAGRRYDSFCATMRDAGLRVREEWVTRRGFESVAGAQGMRDILDAPELPTGVVVASANATVSAASVIRNAGLRIPEDISVVGLLDTWVAAAFVPALTMVRMPLHELGRTAAQALLDVLEGAEPIDQTVSEPAPTLAVRDSTAAPRTT